MKNILFILVFLVSSAVMAQSGFGIKGGLNYGDNGEIAFQDVSNAGEDVLQGGDNKMGYHLGIFYRAGGSGFFIKPELVYTQTKSSYSFNSTTANYEISKIDLPILIGINVLGPVEVFAGPSLQYILDNKFEGIELGDVEEEFTIGAHLGAGIQLGGIGVDVRYERGLKENEATVLNLNNPEGLQRVDSRPSQIIFSLSLNL